MKTNDKTARGGIGQAIFLRSLIPADVFGLFLSNRRLRVLLLTDFLVLLSELSAVVVVPWWITSRGGAQAIAAFGVTMAMASFIVLPMVSPFGDKICKGRQITWGLVALCLLAAVQAGLSMAGFFSLPVLMVVALVQVLAASFVNPARDAVLTELMPQAQLPLAIRMRKMTNAVGGVLGPLLAGAALGSMGLTGALCFYSGLLAAAMMAASRIQRVPVAEVRRNGLAAWWDSLRAGLAAKWLVPMERGWTLVNFVVWIFQGPAVGLLIPIKVHALGLKGQWLGLCLGALSFGVLLGSFVGTRFLVDRFGRYRVRIGLGFLEGIALAFVGLVSSPIAMLFWLAAAGLCNASMGLVGATHRALAIPKEYRVRMFAAASMTTQIAGAIGPVLVGVALTSCSVTLVYTAWGLLMAASVLGLLAVPRLREFLTLGHDEIVDWYRLQYPAIFK